ncbi:MAG: hypothetical protein KDK06_20850 [Gammaproteobacteria bacterium]|nr:hypothetical protein [Gammaproteobacteria bacterium]
MLLTAFLLLALPAVVVTQDFMRDHGIAFAPEERNDFDTFASIRALELRAHRGPAPVVVITGASTTRDVLVSDYLAAEYAARDHGGAEVFKLTTSRQNLWDSIAMLDNVPAGARGIALIGISAGLFSAGPERVAENNAQARYAFRSAAYDEEIARLGIAPEPRYGIYLLDNLEFFLARSGPIARNLLHGNAPPYSERIVGRDARVAPEQWDSIGHMLAERFAAYDRNVGYGEQALDRALGRLRATTAVEPVLVEAPVNPRFLDEFGQRTLFARHARRMRAFAAARGIRFVDLNEQVDMPPADFFDWAHVANEATVERCSRAVAAATADLLPETRR